MFRVRLESLPWKKGGLLHESLNSDTQNSKFSVIQIVLLSISAAAMRSAYRDYRNYMDLGPGGTPHNVMGWLLVSLVFCPLGQEMLSTDRYDCDSDKISLIGDVPLRHGGRPIVGRHVVPQRQIDQKPSVEIMEVSIIYQTLSPLMMDTNLCLYFESQEFENQILDILYNEQTNFQALTFTS